jgi:hypothetical protein
MVGSSILGIDHFTVLKGTTVLVSFVETKDKLDPSLLSFLLVVENTSP